MRQMSTLIPQRGWVWKEVLFYFITKEENKREEERGQCSRDLMKTQKGLAYSTFYRAIGKKNPIPLQTRITKEVSYKGLGRTNASSHKAVKH